MNVKKSGKQQIQLLTGQRKTTGIVKNVIPLGGTAGVGSALSKAGKVISLVPKIAKTALTGSLVAGILTTSPTARKFLKKKAKDVITLKPGKYIGTQIEKIATSKQTPFSKSKLKEAMDLSGQGFTPIPKDVSLGTQIKQGFSNAGLLGAGVGAIAGLAGGLSIPKIGSAGTAITSKIISEPDKGTGIVSQEVVPTAPSAIKLEEKPVEEQKPDKPINISVKPRTDVRVSVKPQMLNNSKIYKLRKTSYVYGRRKKRGSRR